MKKNTVLYISLAIVGLMMSACTSHLAWEEGYHTAPPHRDLRDKPTYNYPSAPPVYYGGGQQMGYGAAPSGAPGNGGAPPNGAHGYALSATTPQGSAEWALATREWARTEQEWADAEMARAEAAREWHRVDRMKTENRRRGRDDSFTGVIVKETGRATGSVIRDVGRGLGRGLSESVRDIFR